MWILIISVIVDQISKYIIGGLNDSISIIPGLLSFEYTENYGAVFGIMQGSNNILAIISLVLCVMIIAYIFTLKKKGEKIHQAWYMILAGGFGNLIDRIIRGYVVDFIATPFIATFNIADSLVVIGVGLLILNEIKDIVKNKKIDSKEENV